MTQHPPQATPQEAMAKLDAYAHELDAISNKLAEIERQLEPVEREYQAFVDDFEVGLWQRSQDDENFKLPSEALRLKLAQKAMSPELLGRYVGLINARRRLRERGQRTKASLEAQRSILSYLKEATVR